MYQRKLKTKIERKFFKGKALILIGARQTGKTTLVRTLIDESKYKSNFISFNCDNYDDREKLTNVNLTFLQNLIGDTKIIFIDEGQKVETIGQTIKLLVDHYKNKNQIIVTGSSAFNLLYKTQEELTGRKLVYNLYPLSLKEIYSKNDLQKLYKELELLLIYGLYPDVVNQKSFKDKREILKELASSYLYKDILEHQTIKSPDILIKLLKALALQIGNEVSYHEISNIIGIDLRTVERYIDLLEKSFIIFKLPPYSTKKRREISRKMNKIYFYDLGIRNALIDNFNSLENRQDVGGLFENFLIVERLKYREYNDIYSSQYFWRTYDGSEVDLIEERGGKLHGFEFKWAKKNHNRKPQKWLDYKNSSYKTITKEDFLGFVL